MESDRLKVAIKQEDVLGKNWLIDRIFYFYYDADDDIDHHWDELDLFTANCLNLIPEGCDKLSMIQEAIQVIKDMKHIDLGYIGKALVDDDHEYYLDFTTEAKIIYHTNIILHNMMYSLNHPEHKIKIFRTYRDTLTNHYGLNWLIDEMLRKYFRYVAMLDAHYEVPEKCIHWFTPILPNFEGYDRIVTMKTAYDIIFKHNRTEDRYNKKKKKDVYIDPEHEDFVLDYIEHMLRIMIEKEETKEKI